jgi:hypothetical protein
MLLGGIPVCRADGRLFAAAKESYGSQTGLGFRGWLHFIRCLLRREALIVLPTADLERLGVKIDASDLDTIDALRARLDGAALGLRGLLGETSSRSDPIPASFAK